jgi:hypothetical protein
VPAQRTQTNHARNCLDLLIGLGFLNCGDHGNERVHFGEFEQLLDARAHSRGNHSQAFRLAPDILADNHAQSHRIHVGNAGQVEDENRQRLIRLRFEQVARKATGDRVLNMSRAVKGPERRKTTAPGALPSLRSMAKVELFQT